MKVIGPSVELLTPITGKELEMIEYAARTCYKSENDISGKLYRVGKTELFIAKLIDRGHEAMLEHMSLSVKIICDRGVSHELVRHRLASFAQESTRYCNYSNDRFGNELTFIEPFFWNGPKDIHKYELWVSAMKSIEETYLALIENGASPQEARSVLPNSLKTEIVMTANYREWRHFLKLRAARETGPAHPQMEDIALTILECFAKKIPVVFDDIYDEAESLKLFNNNKGRFGTCKMTSSQSTT